MIERKGEHGGDPGPNLGTVPIIVLNWNGLADTIECIDSLTQQQHYQDFVVQLIDNGSSGDDFDQLTRRYASHARIKLSANATNLGFTGGVNAALRGVLAQSPTPEAVVLLNNDTVPDEHWLDRLVQACIDQQAAIVGSRMVNYFDEQELDNAGHVWLSSGEILPRGAGDGPGKFAEPAWLMGVCAGAVLIRTDLFEQIGLLDDFFHTGYEDAEFGLRAYLAGFPSYYEPEAVVRHKMSQSVDKVRSPAYARQIQVNINYTYGKLAPATLALWNAFPIFLKTLGVLSIAALSGRFQLLRAHLTALIETLRIVPTIWKARRAAGPLRKTTWRQARQIQTWFLPIHFRYFRRYILTGKKTVFEK